MDMPVTYRDRARGRRFLACVAVAIVAALALAGCGSSSSNDAKKKGGALIGVSFHTNAQQRWTFEAKILKDVAAKNGDSVIVDYANDNVSTQANQVQSMLQRGIKVLVITPVDAKAAAPLVAQAQAQGVKVIAYDVPLT